MWQDTAKALSQRGVEIYSYGIRPGAQSEQVQSITFRPGNSYLIDGYLLPRPIPTGVTGEERTLLLGKPIQHRKHRPVKPITSWESSSFKLKYWGQRWWQKCTSNTNSHSLKYLLTIISTCSICMIWPNYQENEFVGFQFAIVCSPFLHWSLSLVISHGCLTENSKEKHTGNFQCTLAISMLNDFLAGAYCNRLKRLKSTP